MALNPPMRPSLASTKLTKESEGLSLTAYPDPATGGAPWTVGYGSTTGVSAGMVITQEQADARFERDQAAAARIVNAAVTVPITQGQFDALVDFVFNVGPGRAAHGGDPGHDGLVMLKNGQPSTLLKMVNSGNVASAADQFLSWTRGNGKVMPGLVTRRRAEKELFLC